MSGAAISNFYQRSWPRVNVQQRVSYFYTRKWKGRARSSTRLRESISTKSPGSIGGKKRTRAWCRFSVSQQDLFVEFSIVFNFIATIFIVCLQYFLRLSRAVLRLFLFSRKESMKSKVKLNLIFDDRCATSATL